MRDSHPGQPMARSYRVRRPRFPSKETGVFRRITKQISGWKRTHTHTHTPFSIPSSPDCKDLLSLQKETGPPEGPGLSILEPYPSPVAARRWAEGDEQPHWRASAWPKGITRPSDSGQRSACPHATVPSTIRGGPHLSHGHLEIKPRGALF